MQMKHKDNKIVVCLIGQVPYWMKECRCDCVQTSRIGKSWAGQGWQKFPRFVDNKPGSMTGSRVQNNEDFLCEEARTNVSIPLTTTKVASRQPAAAAPWKHHGGAVIHHRSTIVQSQSLFSETKCEELILIHTLYAATEHTKIKWLRALRNEYSWYGQLKN